MAMMLTDPFDALFHFQQALDQLRQSDWLDAGPSGHGSYPLLNVFRKGDDIVVVTEVPGGGTDLIRTSLSSYTLSDNVEHLTFIGTGAFTGAGVPAIALTYREYRRFAAGGEEDADMVAAARDHEVQVVDIEALYAVLEPDPTGRTAAHACRLRP